MCRPQPRSTRPSPLFPYTTLFRSHEVRRLQRIEADLLALEVGDRLNRSIGDDGVTAVGEIDGHHHPMLQALGDRGHYLVVGEHAAVQRARSEEHTSELQSLMRSSYAVFCLKKQKKHPTTLYHE